MRNTYSAAYGYTPADIDPVIVLDWLLRLEELHVEELAERDQVPVTLVVETCTAWGWTPPRSRWTGTRPDMHERLVMWNHGLTWREVARESRYYGQWKTLATEVRAWALTHGHPIRTSKPFGARNRSHHV